MGACWSPKVGFRYLPNKLSAKDLYATVYIIIVAALQWELCSAPKVVAVGTSPYLT